jgi:hypothetical protein
MSDTNRPNEQQQATRGPNGDYIIARRRGLSPMPYGPQLPACRTDELQIIVWLLNAAASGAVGNLAYDYLKRLIEKARKGHEKFLSEWTPLKQMPLDGGWPPAPERVTPDPDLRNDLVELAYDTLARYRSNGPEWHLGQMRPIDVYLTQRGTWAVEMREDKSKTRVLIEIALIEDEARRIYGTAWGVEGFPVSIWRRDRAR